MDWRMSLCKALALCTGLMTTPAAAIDGEILIAQARAMQGGITPGDGPGFPITLTQPGAYKFAGNITVPPQQDGIEVKESDVTINLNGFRLHGLGLAGYGIRLSPPYASLTVKNGTIAGFRYNSVELGWAGDFSIVENMRITHNHGIGIKAGDAFRIVDSTVTVNGGTAGIVCGRFCHVESNLISNNFAHGIVIASGSIINNTIANNGSAGIWEVHEGNSRGSVAIGHNSIYGNSFHSRNTRQIISDTPPIQMLSPNYCDAPCM